MKITKTQLKKIIKEFYSVDVEEYLKANAAEYRKDKSLDSGAIRMLLMDDFMDNIGHSESIEEYQDLIDRLSFGNMRENKMKITKRQLKKIIQEEKHKLLEENRQDQFRDPLTGENLYLVLNEVIDKMLDAGIPPAELAEELRGLADDVDDAGVWSDDRDYEAGFKR